MASQTLIDHFARTRANLLALSNHLGIVNHGDIKGVGREALITQFLNTNLPSLVEWKTGEIIDCYDKKSGQVDIVLQSVSSPRIHLYNNSQISLADAVIATIEVKSTLTTASWDESSHLKNALVTFQKIKALHRDHKLNVTDPSHHPHKNTPCILFAFSGPNPETLVEKYVSYSENYNIDFEDFAPNLTIVLDKDYAIFKNDGWITPAKGTEPFLTTPGTDRCLIPLFVFLCKLIEVWNVDIKHTKFQNYF